MEAETIIEIGASSEDGSGDFFEMRIVKAPDNQLYFVVDASGGSCSVQLTEGEAEIPTIVIRGFIASQEGKGQHLDIHEHTLDELGEHFDPDIVDWSKPRE